jgi:hypothetical protein
LRLQQLWNSPRVILQAIYDEHLGKDIDVIAGLFPSQDELDEMLEELPSNPIDAALSITNPLIPPQSLWDEEELRPTLFDSSGLCEYARLVHALLTAITHERHFARAKAWLLRHAMCLSLFADDVLQIPATENHVFTKDVDPSILQSIISRTQILSAMLLKDVDEGWHEKVTKALASGTSIQDDVVAIHVCEVFLKSASNNSIRDARVLYTTLQRVLSEARTSDAEHWMLLARKYETKGLSMPLLLRLVVLIDVLSPPRFRCYHSSCYGKCPRTPSA